MLPLVVLSTVSLTAQAPPLQLEDMTWREVEAALKGGTDTVVVAVGATEQHGPQLPLAADSIAGDAMAPEIARRLGHALVAPNVRLGVSGHHMMFPGTISVREDVLVSILSEYVHSLAWHGFRHIVIVPTHGGNFGAIGRVARDLGPLYPYVNIAGYTDAKRYIATLVGTADRLHIPPEVAGSHSGLVETSTVLALRPELVRLDKAEAGFIGDAYGVGDRMTVEGTDKISANGVLGDPRRADPELGRESFRDLADTLAEFARRAREGWKPPTLPDLPYGGLPDPVGPLAEGVRLRRAGDFAAARAFFASRLATEPADVSAIVELARAHVLAGAAGEARAALTPLLAATDAAVRIRAHDELAYADLYDGRFQSALRHKRDAHDLAAAAGDTTAQAQKLFYVAYIESNLGHLDAAAAAYDDAFRLTSGVSDLGLDLDHLAGVLDVRRGRLTQAGVRLRRIADAVVTPRFAAHTRRFYHLNGELLLARGRVDEALVSLAPAIRIYDHPLYRETLARAFEKAGRLADAERELRRLIDLRDARLDVPMHYVRAHYALAKIHDAQGRRAEAEPLYRRFLELWGNADVALPEVAEARARLGASR